MSKLRIDAHRCRDLHLTLLLLWVDGKWRREALSATENTTSAEELLFRACCGARVSAGGRARTILLIDGGVSGDGSSSGGDVVGWKPGVATL